MRCVVATLLTSVLGGCALDPFVTFGGENYITRAGTWVVETNVDPITGVAVPSARNATIRSSSAELDLFASPASLQLTCAGTDPVIKIAYDFKVGSSINSILGYRFDDRPGRDDINARFLHKYQAVVIEDRATIAQFVKDMAGATRLVVRTRSFNAPRSVTEFSVEGSEYAVAKAFATCPPDQPLSADEAAAKVKRRLRAVTFSF